MGNIKKYCTPLRMKVFFILAVSLSAVSALPQDRQNNRQCRQAGGIINWLGDDYCDDENNIEICGWDGGDCCGGEIDTTFCSVCACLDPDHATTAGPTAAPTTATPTDTSDCATVPDWMKTAMSAVTGFERIVNGQQAPEPIPWQAHMRQGSTSSFSFFCGGTILDATTILTAAHCYDGKDLTATDFFIAAGATHVADGSAQTAFVESITLHEDYNANTINNDVAILKLKTALTFNDNVKPACLPAATLTPSGVAVASGWGLIGQEPNVSTFDLMYVAKPVILNTQCTSPNTSWGTSQITSQMICAGDADGGESTCSGDSGGPLIIAGDNDVATLIGTTSFGPAAGCGTAGLPAVYAYTIPFLDWITPKMG